MNNDPIISYAFSHQTWPTATNPRRTLQVYINRPNTQQSIIDFKLPSITDNQGNFNDSTIEGMEFLLPYHEIEHPDSTMLIQKASQYMMELFTTENTSIYDDLEVTLRITNYNENASARLDIDLIITDIEETNRLPNSEEENETCTVCFRNYRNGTYLCTILWGHTFHFQCISQWLRTNISVPYVGTIYYDSAI
ncbi:hypothetical protein N665_0090s0011 [Sinapis alba]|nr:hypothetical protein N665_0090s0011 [Sinapis alba]